MKHFIFDEIRTDLLPLMYVKIHYFFYIFSLNTILYIRSKLRQLHIILQEFSTYLCKKYVFAQCLQNCLNFMKVLYTTAIRSLYRHVICNGPVSCKCNGVGNHAVLGMAIQ